MNIKNEVNNFYDRGFIKKISRKGYYKEKLEFYTEYLKSLKKNRKKVKILDIACNDGELSEKFKAYGSVLAIDINKDAIKECLKRDVDCLCTDVYGLPKKLDNYFDIIIAGDIIEHVFDTDRFLRKIYQLLKKGGILLLTTANIASFGRRLMLLFGKNPYTEFSTILPNKEFNVGHIRYYTVENMRDQMNMIGFKKIGIFGDKINLTKNISIPRVFSKYLPTISRYMHVIGEKS